MNEQRIINAAIDCLSRFKITKYPLKNVAKEIISSRNLNSKERKELLAIVFAWARESFLIEDFLKGSIRFFETLSTQEKDKIILRLVALRNAGFFKNEKDLEDLDKKYQLYLLNKGDKCHLLSLGPLIAKNLNETFGDEDIRIAKSLKEKPKKWLAYDKSSLSQDEVIHELMRHGLEVKPHHLLSTALSIDKDLDLSILDRRFKNLIWFMDAGSQIIAELIKPKPHENILDMCAGEGGKARYITQNPCHYVAMDIDGKRLKNAKKRINTKGISFIEIDALKVSFNNKFDWILLDAPCSGSGVIRRNPDLVYRFRAHDLAHYHHLQYSLLRKAVELLAPGGKLIYATCSLFESENKQQIDRLLLENKQLIGYPIANLLVDGQFYLNQIDLNSYSLSLIPHIHDCDGFFIAAITKS